MINKIVPISSNANDELVSVYNCWKSVWEGFLVENNHDMKLFSDEFLMHDEAIAVFNGQNCIALSLMSYIDLNNELHIQKSYFSHWSDLDIAKIKRYGQKAVLCTNFSILKEFRGRHSSGNLRDALFKLSLNRLIDKNCDVLIGTMRCRAKMNETGVEFNGEIIKSGVDHPKFKEPIEVVCFSKDKISYFQDIKYAA